MASILELATRLAKQYHKGQVMKQSTESKKLDYFQYHLLAVRDILASVGMSERTQVIGILHDILEDTKMTYDGLVVAMGKNIADKVSLLSEDKSLPKPERIKPYLDNVVRDTETISVCLADKINNIDNLLKFPIPKEFFDLSFIPRQIKKYDMILNRLKKVELDGKQKLLYNILKNNVGQLKTTYTNNS